MATPLPSASSFTDPSTTEDQFKAEISDLVDYLAGLLGTDGTRATAVNTLGLAAAYNPRGAWASGGTYVQNDYVSYSGATYLCVVNVTGSSTTPDSDGAHWGVISGVSISQLSAGVAAAIRSTVALEVNQGGSLGFRVLSRNVGTGYPVPSFYPLPANSQLAQDLIVSGTPTVGTNGYFTWFDACNADCLNSNPSMQSARVGVRADAVLFGSLSWNGGATVPVYFIVGGSPSLTLNTNGDIVMGSTGATSGAHYANYTTLDICGLLTTKGGVVQWSSSDHSITATAVLDNASFRLQSLQSQPIILGANASATQLYLGTAGDIGINNTAPQHASGYTTLDIAGTTTTTGGQLAVRSSDSSHRGYLSVDATNGLRLLSVGASDPITFATNNTSQWAINSSGVLYPVANGTTDIGSPSHVVRNLYLEGDIFTPVAASSTANSTLFADSSNSNRLSYKNSSGTITVIST